MRAPLGQRRAGRPIVSLAVGTVTERLMRRQTNEWAVGNQSRNVLIPVAHRVALLESSTSKALQASRRGTGGMHDHGTFEEDTPVTWETLVPPCRNDRATEPRTASLRRAARMPRLGRPVSRCKPRGTQNKSRLQGRPRRGKTEGKPSKGGRNIDSRNPHQGEESMFLADRTRESDGLIRAMTAGNEWHRTRPSKGGQC